MGPRLVDMHLHLDSFDEPAEVAGALSERGIAALSVTVTPRRYELSDKLAACENVRLAVGMHPWHFEDEHIELLVEKAVAHARETRFVGEIGLDFYERHAPQATWARQRYALERILSACAEASESDRPHILSLHSVRAAAEVLDSLEKTGAAEACACVFHWFSGSTDELWRAIRMGCWFSCNEKMMQAKRSREYAKLIPEGRLMLETDYPPTGRRAASDEWARDIERSLLDAAVAIAAARGSSAEVIASLACENSLALLAM